MFILIPEKVDQDHDLSPNSKRLMGYIISLNRSTRNGKRLGCIAGNDYLATRIGVSTRQITNQLKELKNKNYIIIKNKKRPKLRDLRIIIPSKNILDTMEETEENVDDMVKSLNKNELPKDIEADWLDDYIANL